MQDPDAKLLQAIVEAIVDDTDAIKIERRVDEMGVLLTLNIAKSDMGKVIGKEGHTAKAIRSLLRVVGVKHSARVNLMINEPEEGQ